MKTLFYVALLLTGFACSPGERENKDLTGETEDTISINQTQPKEEQIKKDSAALDVIGQDTAAQKAD